MAKPFKLFSAVALSAAMAMPVFADEIPLNSTVTGGQGEAKVDGQGLGGALNNGVVVAAGALTVLLIAADGSTVTSTP